MILLVTVHTERDKNIASGLYSELVFQFSDIGDIVFWVRRQAILGSFQPPVTTKKRVTERVYRINCHIATCR